MLPQARFRIRSGDYEIELECSKEEIGSLLSLTDQFIEALNKVRDSVHAIGDFSRETTLADESDKEGLGEEIPQITGKALTEAILELLASPWGREPRTLREIKEALDTNALHYPNTTIHPTLIRLTRQGKVRRLKKGNVLSYVASVKGSVVSP